MGGGAVSAVGGAAETGVRKSYAAGRRQRAASSRGVGDAQLPAPAPGRSRVVSTPRLLELRAALGLSRLWRCQGKRAEARELLVEVHGWFTEGFETADLCEARTLLLELDSGD